MKTTERILIKVIMIQFIFLFLSQIFLHGMGLFPQVKEITKYEGVNKKISTEIIEAFFGE